MRADDVYIITSEPEAVGAVPDVPDDTGKRAGAHLCPQISNKVNHHAMVSERHCRPRIGPGQAVEPKRYCVRSHTRISPGARLSQA